jgi:intraflagellar transport protein 46
MQLNEELENLFAYIEQFKPREIHIGTWLKPFCPMYIPTLGYVDESIKVPCLDGELDYLGLKEKKFIIIFNQY